MAATRASGTNAVRYGTMRENVLGLTVVTASGEVIRTGTRAKKSSAGYDLTRLFVGSEGTLGVMTEITLKLYPLPEAVSAAICHFPSIDARCRPPSRSSRWACRSRAASCWTPTRCAPSTSIPSWPAEAPMLLMEFHGSAASVQEQAETVQDVAREFGGEDFQWASTPEERTAVDGAAQGLLRRHAADPGCRTVTTDTCVPISRLAEMHRRVGADADAAGLPYYIVGHVGDGNFHLSLPDRRKDRRGPARHRRAAEREDGAPRHRAWRAPAPASTASACTRWASWSTRPAPARWR
jgi:D-lactate dehydrogenase (cytochrome)